MRRILQTKTVIMLKCEMNISLLREYHSLFNISVVLLLGDVFENFRNTCLTNYKLDPASAWYFTSAHLSSNVILKVTGIKLELLSDTDIAHYLSETSTALDALIISNEVRLQFRSTCFLHRQVMSSKQMNQRRQTTVCHKWHVWQVESQDSRDQQNAGVVVLEVQKLVDTALTDNQVPFRVHTCDTQTEFYPISDVQLVKDMALHVLETMHGQTCECWWWVKRQHSLRAAVSLLRTSAQQPAGSLSSRHDW